MRKEIFIAIFLGSAIGGIVTYGIYRANQALINKATGNNPQVLELPSATPVANTNIGLSILNPENNIVIQENLLTIQGKSTENAVIAISSENQDFFVLSDENGLFSQEIDLIKGANTIKVTASDGNVLSEEKVINIVYTTELDSQ